MLTEREAEVNRREVAARRLGEQLAKREEAVAGRDARHLGWPPAAGSFSLASSSEALAAIAAHSARALSRWRASLPRLRALLPT